jgi:hypothetical protein
MEHRGIQYSVVLSIEGGWKWSFEINGRTRCGVTHGTRLLAIRHAEREIDRALAPKKIRLKPPSSGE